jgi:SAM-dependent methyltransferase
MVTDYNAGDTAALYQQAKNTLPIYRVDTFSLMQRVGDVSGQTVLDIACGEGHFTRMMRRSGATTAVGMDISESMIRLARQQEAADPLGIDYVVGDARVPADPPQDFDVAVAAFLLVYARDRAELAAMCVGIASRVRPGGRFVTLIVNPEIYHFDPAPDFRKYGFDVRLDENVYDGAPMNFSVLLPDATLEIENYYLPVDVYREQLRSVGFSSVTVHGLSVPEDSMSGYPPGFWDELLAHPVFVILDCVRAGARD